MTTVNTTATNNQHFTASAGDTVAFARAINVLLITTTVNTVTFSLDGGTNFMALAIGTFQFLHINTYDIVFGGTGTVTGIGICL